jgi:hypothetical protein
MLILNLVLRFMKINSEFVTDFFGAWIAIRKPKPTWHQHLNAPK